MFTGIAAWLAQKMLGRWLLKIGAAFRWIFADIHRVIIVALIALTAFLYIGKASEARRADKWAVASLKWQTAYESMVTANQMATDNAKAEKARIETEYKEIEDAKDADIRNRIADAVARVRNKADSGSSSKADLSGIAIATVNPDGAGEASILDDAVICTENTVKVQGWQEWWSSVSVVSTISKPKQ